MQNNELVEANQKLQKELNALRSLAKEAIVEKKKSQTALETLKHQVVHLLGQHDMVPKQGSPTHASQGDLPCPTVPVTHSYADSSLCGQMSAD